MIGVHLIVDGISEEPVNPDTIEYILKDLPHRIDMNILDGPYIVKGVPENPGYTGIEVIDKSHIAIHSFDDTHFLSIDVFSCKPFNVKKTVEYIKELIKFNKITSRVIKREII